MNFFPEDSTSVQDSQRLALIVMDPETGWVEGNQVTECIGAWTRVRGNAPRLYPGSLVWCARRPGRELRAKVEWWLAWQRVEREMAQGILGVDHMDVRTQVKDALEAARMRCGLVIVLWRLQIQRRSTDSGLSTLELAMRAQAKRSVGELSVL